MIRDKVRGLLRRIAVKSLNMEFDTEARKERDNSSTVFDPDKIPKVVQGSGDTPGPNHKEDIGRTWVSAQMAGGFSPMLIDIRPPNETVMGILPNAMLLSGNAVKQNLDRLPKDKEQRIAVYDQTGALGASSIAAWLREQGWSMARCLRGGFAEWLEHDETIAQLPHFDGAEFQIGDPVTLGEDHAFVHSVLTSQDKTSYELWAEKKGVIGIFEASDLNPPR
jgi:rhodanese-related sulfurtransferase